MKICIILNGEIKNYDYINSVVVTGSYDYIICSDGGANHAYSMNIVPDYIIGDLDLPFTIGTSTKGLSKNIYCPGSGKNAEVQKIARSFIGNVVYSQKERNTVRSDGKQSLDCSSYTAQVLSCAGYTIPGVSTGGVNTATLKTNSEKITTFTKSGANILVNNIKIGKTINAQFFLW